MPLFSSLKRKGPLAARVRESDPGAAVDTSSRPGQLGSTEFLVARSDELSARSIGGAAGVPERMQLSSAVYQALSPVADTSILETVTSGPRPHIFAALLTSAPAAHGGDFLRRNLHRELQAQVTACRGDVLAAFKATLAHLDLKFRALHINNSHVLDGTHIAAAYVDFASTTLHLASNGGCRAVVGTQDALGRSQVAVELGRPASGNGGISHGGGRLTDEHMLTMPLDGDVESIILGSSGLWRELPAEQAALRVATIPNAAPHATGGNTAANLAQLALQAVALRSSKSTDPRFAVLRDTATLQQLWTGSKRNYKWGGRQPLRRRRGDVHGDLSAVVIRLDWSGSSSLPRSSLMCKKMCAMAAAGGASQKGLPRSASGASIASARSFASLCSAGRASHWDLVRAHFWCFRPAAAAAARAKWYAAVDAALAAERATSAALHPQQQVQMLPAGPAVKTASAGAEPIAISAVAAEPALTRQLSLESMQSIPEDDSEAAHGMAEAAAAQAKLDRRRASGLATTSYRRLQPGSVRQPSFDATALQQLSVY